MNVTSIITSITIEEFIEEMKKLREKGGEYIFHGIVNKKLVLVNGTGTHNKIFIVNGTKHGGTPDLSVDQWQNELRRAVISR